MSKYIDADKTLAYISRLLGGLPLALLNECEKNGIDIVRCKECRHWAYGKDLCTLHDMGMMADDFCSYGERSGADDDS